jgi:TorA maturation chaperone TorD
MIASEPVENTSISPEDSARAGMYALIARLFYAPPNGALLEALAHADELAPEGERTMLAEAWSALCTAAAAVGSAEAVQDEYQRLFIGVGKAEVTPYGSHYLEASVAGNPLAKLRSTLAEMELARNESVTEPEDHIAALAEVMRFLILGDGESGPAELSAQKDFFSQYLRPWYRQFCEVLGQRASFYRPVAQFARVFLDLERESFETF